MSGDAPMSYGQAVLKSSGSGGVVVHSSPMVVTPRPAVLPHARVMRGKRARGECASIVVFGRRETLVSRVPESEKSALPRMWWAVRGALGPSEVAVLVKKIVLVPRKNESASDRFDIFVEAGEEERIVAVLAASPLFVGFRVRVSVPYHLRPRKAEKPTPVPALDTATLRVMSFNVDTLSSTKKTELEALMMSERVDVLLLQDHRQHAHQSRLNVHGYTSFYVPASVDARGVCILTASRLSASPVSLNEDEVSPHYTVVKIPLPERKCLFVFSVYIPSSRRLRSSAFRALSTAVERLSAEGQVVLGGDWQGATALALRKLDAVNVSGLVEVPFAAKDRTTRLGSGGRWSALDGFLVSAGLLRNTRPARVMRSVATSDHRPVVCRLFVKQPTDFVVFSRQSIDKTRLVEYSEEVRSDNRFAALRHQLKSKGQAQVDGVHEEEEKEANTIAGGGYVAFVEAVHAIVTERNAWKKTEITTQTRFRRVRSARVKSAIKRKSKALVAYQKAVGTPDEKAALENFKTERAAAKSLIATETVHTWTQYVQNEIDRSRFDRSLHGRPLYSFGKGVSKRAVGAPPAVPAGHVVKDRASGQIVCDKEDVLRVWHTHTTALLADRNFSKERSHWQSLSDVPPLSHRKLHKRDFNVEPIGYEEMCDVLSQLGSGSAPGPDMVTYSVLKMACVRKQGGNGTWEWVLEDSNQFGHCLLTLINDMVFKQEIPSASKGATLMMLHKKGDTTEVENYRGISLMSCVLKLAGAIVIRRIGDVVDSDDPEKAILMKYQAGFRRGEECLAQHASLLEICQRRSRIKSDCNGVTWVAFLDMKMAYDSVPHEALFYKLKRIGVPRVLRAFIRACYDDATCRVRLGAELSEAIPVRCGLRQGDVMSPLLFSLFINDIFDGLDAELAVKVPGLSERVPGLLFADDIALCAESPKHLQKMLDHVSAWCDRWGMSVGHAKCGVMCCSSLPGVHRAFPAQGFSLQGGAIPQVESYRYLGLDFYPDLDVGRAAQSMQNSLAAELSRWKGFLSSRQVPLGTKVQCVKTWLVPLASWGAEIWATSQKACNGRRKLLLSAFRMACGVSSTCSNLAMLTALCSFPLPEVFLQSFLYRAANKWSGCKTVIAGLMGNRPSGFRAGTWSSAAARALKRGDKMLAELKDLSCEFVTPMCAESSRKLLARLMTEEALRKCSGDEKSVKAVELVLGAGFMASAAALRGVDWGTCSTSGMIAINQLRTRCFSLAPRMALLPGGCSVWRHRCPFCQCSRAETAAHMLLHCSLWTEAREKYLGEVIAECKNHEVFRGFLAQGKRKEAEEWIVSVLLGGVGKRTGRGGKTMAPWMRTVGKSAPLQRYVFAELSLFMGTVLPIRNWVFSQKIPVMAVSQAVAQRFPSTTLCFKPAVVVEEPEYFSDSSVAIVGKEYAESLDSGVVVWDS